MYIAICDDRQEFLYMQRDSVKSICTKKRIISHIDCFNSCRNLISVFEMNKYAFDLVIMNAHIKGMNIKCYAEELRKVNKDFKLILTSDKDMDISDLLLYDISGFIVKSKSQEYIEKEFERVLSEISEEKKKWLPFEINTNSGGYIKLKIPVSDIIYFDREEKKLKLHTINNNYELKPMNFTKVEELMYGYNFVPIHRSCMVNVDFIHSIDGNNLMLDNGEILKISGRRKKSVDKAFLSV